ncbi:putative late blight resistance protein homolog R1A-3 isoform X1 [Lycium barbarum]|uniref:putative late blight resistance protein homolog R1A-3 isoform X1 n=1 Tax=Lycium barbarum TaxID=112863 RepID=UPI00293EACAB|nr:putative late blight resistance protein homolog R1A-3 isoform X1 [Lycium barbarum]XP_060174759.1 putative late blight resistance protein homolog R1A-3 isoform X1 [Lycium barbarum]XP_060174760.1 putative late blight resistance protein homolog R1A-3 isoform X1 [Lycium barbarum]XP_060174761.1 putative late blight resistance protein homolog R1A-3 isoform X1 [Lycium barbarum]XP_060174762.1 putative late blight resistance protein homolog R1A-3 isoform X1 [Lycium barbarum]XP_060174763.1 putative l
MERGQENEGAREQGEANNFEVSFSALRKDVLNVLDFLERLKNEEYPIFLLLDRVEKLKSELAFICIYVQLSYSDFEQFEDIMTARRQEVDNLLQSILDVVDIFGCEYTMHHVLPSLTDNMDDCISTHHHSKSSATMTEDQLNFLLLNLHHLSMYRAEHIHPLVTEYEILQNVCRNIRDFHGLIVNGCIEHEIVDYVLPQFQLMAERVGLFLWDDQTDEDSQLSELDEDDQINGYSRLFELAHLLMKIIPIELEVMHICFTNLKALTSSEVGRFINQLLETSPDILREFLIHLQEHMVNVITPGTSGDRNIHVMMEFLLIIITDMPKDFIKHDRSFDLLARVVALTRKVSTVVRDLAEKSRNKESTDETNRATLNFLENIELLKKDFKRVYLKDPDSSQCCFPMSDGLLFMHLLHRHLNDLLESNAYSVALIKEEIGMVKEGLESVRSFVVNAEPDLYKDLWERVLDVAYEAKNVIDSIIVRDNGLLHLIFSLPNAIEKINLIKEEVSNLHEKIPKSRGLTVANSPNKPAKSKSLTTDKIIVGFEEETNWIIKKLTSGPADLDVISITGMPGSGKTTLAYKVYHDKSVCSHFDRRAWCTVEQEYDEKKLWQKLFNQVTGSDLKISEDIDVADKLRRQLFGKRYLIVLDDLWDTTAWDALTRPFPEFQKGSRVILTTREKKVALHGKRNSDPLNLRLLKLEESWELLEKRAFGKESCPDELLNVGKEIAQNCEGLPLVADLIVGVIAGKEKKKTVWLEVRNNLSSFIFNNEVEVMKVIELSYNHLADPLKSCFLYLASWRKDTTVNILYLKDLWRAEGLVEQTEMKSVEEVMEVYLDNLISSSLVIFFNEVGAFPTFQLHDLVHDFCLIKAKEEKLFDQISSSAPSYSSDLMPRKLKIDYAKKLFGINNFVLFSSKKKRHSGRHLYSLEIKGDKMDGRLSDICHLGHLRLLRVLDLHSSFIKVNDSLLNEICMLNHLRYLNIGTKVKSLPASFSNLCNLETLLVENEGPPLVLLPTIWNLVKLRLLSIGDSSFFDLDTNEPILIAEDSKLENLRILKELKLSYSKETEDIFKRFPNLQILVFYLKESWDCSTERYWFPKLDFPNELDYLWVKFESSNRNDSGPSVATNGPWDFHFPSNLKKLVLKKFPLTSDSLSTIARLPNLEELYLANTIIQGEEWNMGEEDTFEKLKCLKLKYVTLAKWEFGEESFPVLEKLELRGCDKLEEIPSTFGDIYSLKIIKLARSPQLEESALKIKQYAEDMRGGDELQILDWNNIPLFK